MAHKTILITGANRGIGFSIVEALARRSPEDVFILASRKKENAEEAIKTLRETKGISAKMHPLRLDITNEDDIDEAVEWVDGKFGQLDVLVNNAGFANQDQSEDRNEIRNRYRKTFEVNVISVVSMITAFERLLRKSSEPRVINVSSNRGSLTRSSSGSMAPTVYVSYSISKTCLNALGLELIKAEDARNGDAAGAKISFYLACPGFCKTEFNGYKGIKDPLMGARVVVELATAAHGQYKPGFWEYGDSHCREGVKDEMMVVPW